MVEHAQNIFKYDITLILLLFSNVTVLMHHVDFKSYVLLVLILILYIYIYNENINIYTYTHI